MRLVLAVLLTGVIISPACAQELSGEQITSAIVSPNELLAKTMSGVTIKLQYKSDGSAFRQRTDGKMISGKWTVRGNILCTVWDDIGERCIKVVKKSHGYDMLTTAGRVYVSF